MTSIAVAEVPVPERTSNLHRYREIRAWSETLCEPLEIEDYVVQTMPDVSPTKWHLAHTTWFFETFVLGRFVPAYRLFRPEYGVLFNSYYETVGEKHPRPQRGLLSRPTVTEIMEYRCVIDEQMCELLEYALPDEMQPIVELGLQHEQQHQELILTDVKHVLATNPLRPKYATAVPTREAAVAPLQWKRYDGSVRPVGHSGGAFSFDNESPRHDQLLRPFELATRLVTCGEFLEFMEDGGYRRPELWLSDGWQAVQTFGWQAPLYWEWQEDIWRITTLGGVHDVQEAEPVCHVSFYEADAYARWANCRLPTEFEWEVAAADLPIAGNFVEQQEFHPVAANAEEDGLLQVFGDVWEWTSSPYAPYPGYRPWDGALGEYNGKFMCNQMVLRGGSCATPQSHIRPTYRNFFQPEKRWQFMGFRLARDPRN